jgi:hypothetical protein
MKEVRLFFRQMKVSTYPALLILISCLASSSWAELSLDVKAIEVKPKPDDETTQVDFVFRNTGDKPVRVLRLESSCSCLNAELDKEVYAPGEKGSGKAEFKISSFTGRMEKIVKVFTDDPAQPEWEVPFILDIPSLVEIEPKMLQWWVGDEPVERSFTVKFDASMPLAITKLSATRENVSFSFKEITPRREYQITVQPKSTADVTLGALKIETDSTILKYQRQLAYFSIYPKPAEEK